MPRLNEKTLIKNNLFLLDTTHVKDIVNLVKDIEENSYDSEKYLKQRKEIKIGLPKISEERFIGITQISEGCLGECSYCIVRLAKGTLFSYPKEDIINSVKNDISSGCKEIWITSQDNSSYGNEQGNSFLPELLKEIVSLEGKFFIRLGMMNPDNILKILPELIENYKSEKMFKFLHIPIQSGSNKILKEMNRKYTREDVLKIVEEFRKEIPKITISTDVIVGYPGETEKDFNETLDLIEKINPEILNRSNFYPRPKTPAASLQQISPDILNERARKLSEVHLDICKEIQKPYLGRELKAIVSQKGFGNTYLGRTENYKLVAVHSQEKILGKTLNVKVKQILPHYLIAEVKDVKSESGKTDNIKYEKYFQNIL